MLPRSGLRLTAAYRDLDAEARFAVASIRAVEPPECRSGEVLQGLIHPGDCAAFGTLCTPDHPLGAPMVSSEGACAAYWKYGRGSGKARVQPVEVSGHDDGLDGTVPDEPGPLMSRAPRRPGTSSSWPTARGRG